MRYVIGEKETPGMFGERIRAGMDALAVACVYAVNGDRIDDAHECSEGYLELLGQWSELHADLVASIHAAGRRP